MTTLDDNLDTIYWMISRKAADTKSKKVRIKLHNTAKVINAARDKIKEQTALIKDLKNLKD